MTQHTHIVGGSWYRGSFARSKHVGLATLHVYRMADARSEYVGLTALHLDRMGEARFEHVGLTTHLAGKVLQRFQSLPSKI